MGSSGTYSITTPIYYVNDRPHIGHCYTTVVADAAARFQRLIGKEVFFLTGTDEHGQKVEKSAAARGVTPQALADENAAEFQRAMALIGASNDDFIRTTQKRHTRQVQAAFKRLIDSGDIYLGTFQGWYDEGQEEYVTENQAREKDFKGFNGTPFKRASEENYYFKLSAFQARLEKFYADNPTFIRPEARRNEVLSRVREGLQDVPVSRTNFSWGIPVIGADGKPTKHVTYVWVDALLNYTTALGVIDPKIAADEGIAPGRAKFWPADVHLIGKEILWFHAVIWPALLMGLGLPLPKCVYAHSFWISEGKKMSKTLGNFIDLPTLQAYISKYGLDALRWYLLTQGPLGVTDADFAHAKFVEVYNADLANGIGNCASRVGNMIEKYFGGKMPEHAPWMPRARCETVAAETASIVEGSLDGFGLQAALGQASQIVREVDQFINETAPFKLAKTLETDASVRPKLASILYTCAECIRIASLVMAPAMPGKMTQLWKTWNCTPPNGVPLAELCKFGGPHGLKAGQAITKGEPLFMRADPAEAAPKP